MKSEGNEKITTAILCFRTLVPIIYLQITNTLKIGENSIGMIVMHNKHQVGNKWFDLRLKNNLAKSQFWQFRHLL